MKKFTYNGTVYNFYSKRRKNSLLLAALPAFGLAFSGNFFKFEIPDFNSLINGSMTDEQQYSVFWILFLIIMFGICIFDAMTAANALQGVELSCLEVYKSHILIIYNSQTSERKPPIKNSIRLEYTDIQKIDYEESIPKWKRTNFSVYHRTGVIELCLDDAEEAAATIDQMIQKHMECVSSEENESENNDRVKRGEKITNEKRMCKPVKAASIGVCPRCGAEFELPDGCKEICCPSCFTDLEV